MQVLKGTRKDPGFGVRPAQDDSPEEAERVGIDYQMAMYKRYDGDMAKAAAAYTDGPGTVDRAVEAYGSNWLSAMPQQAKNRVAALNKQLNQGAGAAQYSANGTGQSVSPTNINVNINATVNGKEATATATATNGQTVTQQVNIAGGSAQSRR